MRVISQKGIGYTLDIPYEQVSVEARGSTIYLNSSTGTNARVIASYSTPEKAEKAMKKLHDAYMGVFIAKEIECSPDFEEALKETLAHGFGIIAVKKDCESASFEPANIVFRFPEDSEV